MKRIEAVLISIVLVLTLATLVWMLTGCSATRKTRTETSETKSTDSSTYWQNQFLKSDRERSEFERRLQENSFLSVDFTPDTVRVLTFAGRDSVWIPCPKDNRVEVKKDGSVSVQGAINRLKFDKKILEEIAGSWEKKYDSMVQLLKKDSLSKKSETGTTKRSVSRPDWFGFFISMAFALFIYLIWEHLKRKKKNHESPQN